MCIPASRALCQTGEKQENRIIVMSWLGTCPTKRNSVITNLQVFFIKGECWIEIRQSGSFCSDQDDVW